MSSTENEMDFIDDKNIITDVAFGVDDKLLSKPLASPTQRGVAMMIDAFLVMMLTYVGGVFWGLLAGIAVFKFGKKQQQKRWRFTRFLLRFVGSVTIFVSVLVFFENSFNNEPKTKSEKIESYAVDNIAGSVKLATKVIELATKLESQECDYDCYNPIFDELNTLMVEVKMPEEAIKEMISDMVKEIDFPSKSMRNQYRDTLISRYQQSVSSRNSAEALHSQQNTMSKGKGAEPSDELTTDGLEPEPVHHPKNSQHRQTRQQENEQPQVTQLQDKQQPQPVYSLVEFGKGIIADLGLGFGWAALYFTAFSTWWRGQTPGKRLLGIRVIQLDGTYMSAWDAFGRYGGYGAGFATGLLGFLQIYWDSNRQAIQDKISATVVIKGDL